MIQISRHDKKRGVVAVAKRLLELLTESMFYVLLALLGGEKCGTEISAFIEEKTRGAVPMGPGTLYTILGRFLEEGYIRETYTAGRRKGYELTDQGRAAYDRELDRLRRCVHDAESEVRR